jgi:hypothetical protein
MMTGGAAGLFFRSTAPGAWTGIVASVLTPTGFTSITDSSPDVANPAVSFNYAGSDWSGNSWSDNGIASNLLSDIGATTTGAPTISISTNHLQQLNVSPGMGPPGIAPPINFTVIAFAGNNGPGPLVWNIAATGPVAPAGVIQVNLSLPPVTVGFFRAASISFISNEVRVDLNDGATIPTPGGIYTPAVNELVVYDMTSVRGGTLTSYPNFGATGGSVTYGFTDFGARATETIAYATTLWAGYTGNPLSGASEQANLYLGYSVHFS